jgi:hypothetical protein
MIRKLFLVAGCGMLVAFFAACSPKAQPVQTSATAAAQTMQAILTQISDQIAQSATMAPSPTVSNTPTPAITDTFTIIPTVPLNGPTATLPGGLTPINSTPTGPTPTTDPNSLLTRTLVGKCPAAFFVGDVGPIRDNSEVKAGKTFTKTWDVRNIGLCSWNRSYQLYFFGTGQQHMNGPNAVNFPEIVPPNKDTFLSVTLIAPDSLGVHTGTWYLKDDQGNRFGVGPDGNEPLIVRIKVVA